jgi:transcriptional regulator CtsR
VIAKIIEALSEIIEQSTEEFLDKIIQNDEIAMRFNCVFAGVEQYCQYPGQIS